MLPSGTVWDFRRSRLLTGYEQLSLQGIQFEHPEVLSNNQMQDIAGNAFHPRFLFPKESDNANIVYHGVHTVVLLPEFGSQLLFL